MATSNLLPLQRTRAGRVLENISQGVEHFLLDIHVGPCLAWREEKEREREERNGRRKMEGRNGRGSRRGGR